MRPMKFDQHCTGQGIAEWKKTNSKISLCLFFGHHGIGKFVSITGGDGKMA